MVTDFGQETWTFGVLKLGEAVGVDTEVETI